VVDQALDPDALAHHQRLLALIQQEIAAADGALSFDRFMELALYAPGLGYYVAGLPKLGAEGDFVTAPEISPLFAGCLAVQACEVLSALGGGDVLEFGAGSGVLAADLLAALARQNALPGEYLILEPSPDLQARQRELISARVPRQAERVRWLSALPRQFQGVVIANEVLDAMPVHRFCIDSQGVPAEVFVTVDESDGQLVETTAPPRSIGLQDAVLRLQARGLALEPGYCSEVNLRLGPWMRALAGAMERGLVLIIDYGYPRREYYHPQRGGGTLISHHRHRTSLDPFERLGLQDISAHVDFSAVAAAARAAGFGLAGYSTQANFLIGCGLDRLMMEALAASADPHQQMQLSTGARQLVLPAAMGERFQAIGLTRELDQPWRGFAVRDLRERLGV
jgi:SAM-dependent MidA family methyltransferase